MEKMLQTVKEIVHSKCEKQVILQVVTVDTSKGTFRQKSRYKSVWCIEIISKAVNALQFNEVTVLGPCLPL